MKRTIIILAAALVLVALLFAQLPDTDSAAGVAYALSTETADGTSLATGNRPVIYVLTPVDACAIRYCLTADAVRHWISSQCGDRIEVIAAPVYAAHVYHDGTPPPLFVAWPEDRSPTTVEWLPQAELTQYGWGLANTQVVYVSADGRSHHHFDQGINMDLVAALVGDSAVSSRSK